MRFLFAVLVCLPFTLGCASFSAPPPTSIESSVDSEAVPYTSLEPRDRPEDFHFAVVTDRTGEHREHVFEEAMPKVNLLQPAFVVSVGDLIEGYTNDAARIDEEWNEFEGFVDQLEMPFFYAPGNHDMSNAVMAEAWRKRFGPSFYHFKYKGALFVVLNSELFGMVHSPKESLPGPWSQAEQMVWVEKVLAENADARWTFVIVHQPLWDQPKIHPDWLRVEEMLGDRGHTVFAGHKHNYLQSVRQGRNYITLATVGGGSRLRGTAWGEFDHVAFVRVGAENPVLANVEIDGIHPVDIVTKDQQTQVAALSKAITVLPVAAEGVGASTAVYEIVNPLDTPLDVVARFDGRPDLEMEQMRVHRVLAPGATDRIEVPIRARRPVRLEELHPGRAHFTLEAGNALSIELEKPIVLERPFAITQATGIQVDGDTSEWGALRFHVDTPAEVEGHGRYRGSEDASFRFDLRQDGENVYLAVRVKDDSFVSSPDKVAREQDGVVLSLDPRPAEQRNANPGFFSLLLSGEFRRIVTKSGTVAEAAPDPLMALFAAGLPDVGSSKAREIDGGYEVEMSVPHSALDEFAGGRWEGARFNIGVSDFDANERDHTTIYWRPNRFGGAAAEGSGTVVR